MTSTKNILVVGAGIGGLAAAIGLAEQGHGVRVAEIMPDLSFPGVGIGFGANAMRVLKYLGVLEECLTLGVPMPATRYHDKDGALICEAVHNMGGGDVPVGSIAMRRMDLLDQMVKRALDVGVELSMSTTAHGLRQFPNRVTVEFNDTSTDHFDLVVGCDGVRSATRELLFGSEAGSTDTGAAAWRVEIDRIPGIASSMNQGHGVKVGLSPLDDERMMVVAITAETGRPRHDPRELPRLLRERLASFTGLVGSVRDAIPDDAEVLYRPMDAVWQPPPWFVGRVLLIGDAAHATTPHLGQGGAMALEDGMVLAECLKDVDDVPTALERFQARRLARVRLIQVVSVGLLKDELDTRTPETYELQVRRLQAFPQLLDRVLQVLDTPA